MSSVRTKVFIFSIVIIALHSCTIEKRLYTGGFHVDWHNRSKAIVAENRNTPAAEIQTKDDEYRAADSLSTTQVDSSFKPLVTAGPQHLDEPENAVDARTKSITSRRNYSKKQKRIAEDLNEEQTPIETNDQQNEKEEKNYGVKSLIFSLLGVAISGLAFFALASAVTLGGLLFFLLILTGLLLSIAAFALGTKELNQNGKQEQKIAAIFGLLFSGFYLLCAFVAFLALLIAILSYF